MRLIRRVAALLAIATMIAAVAAFGLVRPASAASSDCKVYNKKTLYVICVDVSAQKGSVRSAKNGKIGDKVISTFTVSTSRVDSDGPKKNGDTITRQGQFLAYNAQEYTSEGLQHYIQFGPGEQGVHYYPNVGPKYDSHGCVRVGREASDAMWKLLVSGDQGNLVTAGRVEVHIYP